MEQAKSLCYKVIYGHIVQGGLQRRRKHTKVAIKDSDGSGEGVTTSQGPWFLSSVTPVGTTDYHGIEMF
jgi:hypothetical protein